VGDEKLAEVPQLDQLRMEVQKDTLEFYEIFLAENPNDRQVQFELAKSYRRIGMMHHIFYHLAAAQLYRDKAIVLLDELHRHSPSHAPYRYELAVALFQAGWLSRQYQLPAIDLFEGLVQEFPDDVSYREGLADSLRSWTEGKLSNTIGQWVDAEQLRPRIEQTFAIARSPGVYKRHLGHAYDNAAGLAVGEGRLSEAETARQEAIHTYKLAVAERPTEGLTRQHLIISCGQLAHFLEQRGDDDEAERWYREAIVLGEALTHDFPHMRNFRQVEDSIVERFIKFLKKRDRRDEGLEILAQIKPIAPQDFVTRAQLYTFLNEHDLARADYQQAVDRSQRGLERDRADVGLYKSLFEGLSGIGRRKEAVDLVRSMATPDVESLYFYGQIYIAHMRDPDDQQVAIRLLSQLVQQLPKCANCWIMRAIAFGDAKQYEKALKDYDEAIRLASASTSGSATLWTNRALVYIGLKRYEDALADCNKAMRLEPANPYSWHVRGLVYSLMKQFDKAIEDFSEAIRLEPRDDEDIANCLSSRGNAYREWGRYPEAIADYEAALDIDKTHWHPQINLAWLLATADENEYRDGQRALELAQRAYDAGDFGSYGEAKFFRVLAAAHAEAGDFEKALECCKKAIDLAADDAELLEELTKHLASYQAGKPWRIGDEEK
ncbi:MAG: tetratricopeptide repeat protein, partial [Pirellulales bacterium]